MKTPKLAADGTLQIWKPDGAPLSYTDTDAMKSTKFVSLLEGGVRLMPLGTKKRADWILEVQRATHGILDHEVHAINELERDAILAGLRLLQMHIEENGFYESEIGAIYTNSGSHSGLSDPSIDALSDRLNIG